MIEDDQPYLVPMNFGYKENCLYFHSAREGRKIEILKKNPKVCFEFEVDTQLIKNEEACSWSMKYRSIIGTGCAEFLESLEEKKNALDIIMDQYSPDKVYTYPSEMVASLTLFKVSILEISGKQSGFGRIEE
jgi:nitroimidazol reductase NimA-like FMN-containing flavoprotein (pyridoxamine 5'-phosphate oxidase superfamily)